MRAKSSAQGAGVHGEKIAGHTGAVPAVRHGRRLRRTASGGRAAPRTSTARVFLLLHYARPNPPTPSAVGGTTQASQRGIKGVVIAAHTTPVPPRAEPPCRRWRHGQCAAKGRWSERGQPVCRVGHGTGRRPRRQAPRLKAELQRHMRRRRSSAERGQPVCRVGHGTGRRPRLQERPSRDPRRAAWPH
jgi:hypothetical protein